MRWVPDWDLLDGDDGPNFIINGISLTVRDATSDRYKSALRHVIGFMVRRKLPLELASFCRFLSGCRRQGAAGSTLEAYRSAMVWTQRASGSVIWADDPLLVRAIKGYKYQDRLSRPPRGAIDIGMLEELCNLHPEYTRFYIVIFYGVLRVSQAARLRGGDISQDAAGGVHLTLRQDKRMKCGSTREFVSVREVVHPAAREIMLTALRAVPHGALIFATVDLAEASLAIKKAAVTLKWPAGLVWDGVHCLRHGGAQLMKMFVSELLARAGRPCAMSAQTLAWYTRLNAIRVEVSTTVARQGYDEDDDDEEAADE